MADGLDVLKQARLEACEGLDVSGTPLVESTHVHVDHPFELKITVRNDLPRGSGHFKNINIRVWGSKYVELLESEDGPAVKKNQKDYPQGNKTLAEGQSLDRIVWVNPKIRPSLDPDPDQIAKLEVAADFDIASYFACAIEDRVLYDIQVHA